MGKPKIKLAWKVVLVCSLLSPFAFFSSTLNPWGRKNPVGSIGQEIVYPFEFVWDQSTGLVRRIWKGYFALRDAAKENEILKAELREIKVKLLDYEEQQNEITRLRGLLGFAEHFKKEHIVAEVINSSRADPFNIVRVGRGSLDGVDVGMPVVTAQGIVGRTIRTGLKHADVQLLVDANFNLDVLVARNRIRGVLKGSAGQNSVMKLNKSAEIRIGDTVITSGIVGGFPKGLPVGRVVRISYEADHISQTITIEPWVNHRTLEEVIVLKTHDPELQKIVNTVGKSWLNRSLDRGKGQDRG